MILRYSTKGLFSETSKGGGGGGGGVGGGGVEVGVNPLGVLVAEPVLFLKARRKDEKLKDEKGSEKEAQAPKYKGVR